MSGAPHPAPVAPAPPRRALKVPVIQPVWTRLVASVLAALLLAWTGTRVWRVDTARRAELNEARATLATFADWRRRYEPAVAAESVSWRRTMLELQALGVVGDERLAMTRYVARAAEEAGLRDVRVIIGPPDTTGSDTRLSTEGIRRKPASFSLSVEARGGLRAVVGFLGQLPPSMSATHLSLVRQGGSARHRLELAVYELTFANGPPPYWSSVGSDRSDRGRPRGSGG